MLQSKTQTMFDAIHEKLSAEDATGRLTDYFKETYTLDHTVARSQTTTEVMIIDDVIADPFHIDTWFSYIQGLQFSSPIRSQFAMEFYLISMMSTIADIALQAPAAATMFNITPQTIKNISPDATHLDVIEKNLDEATSSQSGYLIINPLHFWKIVENILPDDMVASVENPLFVTFIDKLLNELMLHEVNHHINGHTIQLSDTYSPLKPELEATYREHKFAFGKFTAPDEHALHNIVEDYMINSYLDSHITWPQTGMPSIFDIGVSERNNAINETAHGLDEQSVARNVLQDIELSSYERMQAFTDSDILIEDEPEKDKQNNSNDDSSTLSELAQQLADSNQNYSDADAHAKAENVSEIDKEIAKAQIRESISEATETSGKEPGLQGEDYRRTVSITKTSAKLPKLSVKLAKIKRQFSKQQRVNWSMPHQIMSKRLDLHRIEPEPLSPEINVWIDTSGSMSHDEISGLLSLIISNYVDNKKTSPLIIHQVSYDEIGEPILVTNKHDIQKLKRDGLSSNGGTSFNNVLANLPMGRNIILSDFEWDENDISDNVDHLSNPEMKNLWINSSDFSNTDWMAKLLNNKSNIIIQLQNYEM